MLPLMQILSYGFLERYQNRWHRHFKCFTYHLLPFDYFKRICSSRMWKSSVLENNIPIVWSSASTLACKALILLMTPERKKKHTWLENKQHKLDVHTYNYLESRKNHISFVANHRTISMKTFVLMATLTRSVYHLYRTRLLITHVELRDGLSSITEDASDVFMLYEDPNSSLFKSKGRSSILLIKLNFFS